MRKKTISFLLAISMVVTVSIGMAQPLPAELIPMGNAIGIQAHINGVMVIGLTAVTTNAGERTPAQDAGLKVNDTITHVNDTEVESTQDFHAAVQQADGSAIKLGVTRDGKTLTIKITPAKVQNDTQYRLGVYIRDRIAGIGTVTYFDPISNRFGALGHGIHDPETSQLLPLESGTVSPADIIDVKRGLPGDPGELRGSFDLNDHMGDLYSNTENGIFGTTKPSAIPSKNKPLPIAQDSEISTGMATIYCQVSDDQVRQYDIEIIRLLGNRDSRNMIVKVTDPELIAKTGGIVQGMSGSPIVQNGKLIGAITHVFVNDAQKGYGIFISNMLKSGESKCCIDHASAA
ncbi:MAG: SpoIVB peptidase [Oscillospiraceae bacterium]|nr:SpoIVB peptidase [Oscillospiraceae bacterium]